MIPKIIHRTVPQQTTPLMDLCWKSAKINNPEWHFISIQDPLNKNDWPITSSYWDLCLSSAHVADLIRLETLYTHGGIYLDSDVYVYRPLDSILFDKPFAGKESARWICNAVIGAPPQHPAILALIEKTINLLKNKEIAHGPYIITDEWEKRKDVIILPEKVFYPYPPGSSSDEIIKSLDSVPSDNATLAVHIWAGSWLNSIDPETFKKLAYRWENEK